MYPDNHAAKLLEIVRQLRHYFGPFHTDVSLYHPHTRGCQYSPECPWLLDANGGLQSDVMPDSCRQAGAERPAMVHVFSNGGAFLWARALAMAAARGSQELTGIKGQVIDSTYVEGWADPEPVS